MEAALNGLADGYAFVPIFLCEVTVTVGKQQRLKPWYCSVGIKCMRSVVQDTRDFGALFTWTGELGAQFAFPVALEVWGDVRVEIYRHRRLDPTSKRTLCMFTTFNTAFHGGKERLVLSKHKIDILHKDRANKHTPAHFAMTLHFQPRDAEATASKASKAWRVANRLSFESICESLGSPVTYRKGQVILADGDGKGNSFFYCTRGAVEGVVPLPSHTHDHLHGMDVPEHTHQTLPVKVPCLTIRGRVPPPDHSLSFSLSLSRSLFLALSFSQSLRLSLSLSLSFFLSLSVSLSLSLARFLREQ